MKAVTPRQKLNQTLILSRLLEKPLRSTELWEAVRFLVRSKQTFVHNLDSLQKKGVVERVEKSHKNVVYRFVRKWQGGEPSILSYARRIGSLGSVELIEDCMNFMIKSQIFASEEEAVQAAIDFWVERYRNLCVLGALYSLPIFDEKVEVDKDKFYETAMSLRKLYQTTEDKFFEVLLRFGRKHLKIFTSVLKRKMFLKGVELKPAWLELKFSKFLQSYYPEAYRKLGGVGKAKLYAELREKEKEKEYFTCLKFKRELPRWICNLCRYRPLVGFCKHHKPTSLREKILSKREKLLSKGLT